MYKRNIRPKFHLAFNCGYYFQDEIILFSQVANAMVVNWAGPPAMISLFRKMYGSHSCPDIVRRNHFNNFQHYFLQKALVVAMSKQRNIHGICPPEILKFVLDLFKYNDNSRNKVCC